MTLPTMSISNIDKYYKLRAKHTRADHAYELMPTNANFVARQSALADLLMFSLMVVAELSGDDELTPVSWRDF